MQESATSKMAGAEVHRTSERSEGTSTRGAGETEPGTRERSDRGWRGSTLSKSFEPMWRAFPADLAYGSAVRQAIQSAATDRLVPPDDTADLVLAVSEAFTNAVRHGNCHAGDCIWMAVEWKAGETTIQMRYLGDRFDTEEPTLPPASSHRGRGRYIMNRLLDEVEYHFEEPWTELRMVRRFRPHGGAPARG